MKNKFIVSFLAFGLTATMFSCEGEPTIDEGIDVVESDTLVEIGIDESLFESPDVDYHLPSALQVASIFKKSGLKFNPGVGNSPDNSDAYTSEISQQLNFGVYSADLAYCVANEQSNDARKYITVIKDLANAQGMEAVFDNKDLMDRFDQNLENSDSVESIMIEIHERTEEYMDENNLTHTSAIHYAGAWTEGMYLGFYDYEHGGEKTDVGAQLTEQMEILNNIIKGLKDPKNNGTDVAWVIADLENIQGVYDGFESVKAFNADENAVELVLSDDEIKTIGKSINELRAKIVNA
ncbi:MAG: hypothetical protein ACWA41_04000 [Putridiphycobacter sp.]